MKEVSFAHFHSPIFFAKSNWKDKIDTHGPMHKGKIQMFRVADGLDDGIKLVSGPCESIVPISNVISYNYEHEKKGTAEKIVDAVNAVIKGKPGPKPKGAQAQTPNDHVFANAPGKTRD